MAKFRSWNEKENQFYYWEDGEYNFCGGYTELNHRNRFSWKNAEQSTGLKDKNGKKIFAGDKLSFTIHFYGGYERDYQGIVKFEDCCFWAEIDEDTRYLLAEIVINDDECEIIGNIHENAEMLEEK